MSTIHVYEIDSDWSDDRPTINYDDPRTVRPWEDAHSDEFDRYLKMEAGEIPDEIFEVSLWTFDGRGAERDVLPGVGKVGIWSERMVFEFAKLSGGSFYYMPAKLDGKPFFIPMRRECLDCLDHSKSELKYFPKNPSKVMRVKKFAFHRERLSDPLVFCIPEFAAGLLVTSKAKEAIEAIKPVGVEFKLLEETPEAAREPTE